MAIQAAGRPSLARKVLAVGALAAGVAAGIVLLRRGTSRRRERVDLYYADGSMVSLSDGSPDAERLLSLGRSALRTAGP
jgi:hypothetical protein